MIKLTNYINIIQSTLIALFITQLSFAQEELENHPYLDQSFLIIASSADYNDAETIALQAKEKLGLDYPTKEFYPDKVEGFKTDEVCNCGEIHGYFPRGSHDDGNYVSIEFSSAYQGFTEGYYIVIVSSGPREDVGNELPKIQKYFKQAYIKNSEIYVGCMH